MNLINFNAPKVILAALIISLNFGCTHVPESADKHFLHERRSRGAQTTDGENPFKAAATDEGVQRQLIDKLEKDKTELELQNSILMKALAERKKVVQQLPKGEIVQQFPDFEELIFDQAKTAYKEKDEDRLQEAIRILRANQPSSKRLEVMFFWLAQIQEGKDMNSQALVTYNEFIKMFPESKYVPQAKFLKGKLYEKLNLNTQAMKIYEDIRAQHPDSRERHFADAKLESMHPKKEVTRK
jgi:TolA-binding protein